jgi:hypothetical protein
MREQRFAALRRGLAAIAAIVALAAPAALAAAPATAATHTPAIGQVVLISAPPPRVLVGHTFPVGAWFQAWSGGRRHYTVAVYYGPNWQRVFYHEGWASPTAWQIWNIRAAKIGYYRTVYHCWVHGVWTRTVFLTHSI